MQVTVIRGSNYPAQALPRRLTYQPSGTLLQSFRQNTQATRLIFALLGLSLFAWDSARGLDPSKSITQYTQDVWNTEAGGLPSNSVVAIAQLSDGYLWVGTEEGLARFDGVRFTIFDKRNTPALQSNHISALVASSHGGLWIGTQGGGITKFRNGAFTTYTTRNGLANDAVLALYEDEMGALWIGTNGGGLQRLQNGKFTTYTTEDGLPNNAIFCLSKTRDGSLWMGTHDGLARFKDKHFFTYTTNNGLPDNYVKSLGSGARGELWIGTNQGGVSRFADGYFKTYTTRDGLSSDTIWSIYQEKAGAVWIGTNNGGLNRLHDGVISSYSTKDGLPADTVMSSFEDREGNLWIGTRGGGLVRLKDSIFTVFTSREGLTNDVILPVFEDHSGAIWVGTNGGGIDCLKAGKIISSYSTKNGLSDNVVLAIAEDRDNDLWIATRKALNRLKDGKTTAFTASDGLPTDVVLSLYKDRKGTLWAGTRAGLCRFDGHRFTTYTTKDGLTNDYVSALYADERNTLWIGTGGGGLNKFEDGRFVAFTKQSGLSSEAIWSLTGDPDGTLWIGTSGGGLDRLKDGKITAYTVRNGLFDDELFAILDDRHGYLWMSSNKGIFRVRKAELDAYAEGHLTSINSMSYGNSDGLKNRECNGGFQPAGWQAADGRLFFPTMKGLAIVDPARLSTNRMAPPVAIEQVTIDGSRFGADEPIKAKPGNGQLEFDFTALSLVSSERVRFKYELTGFDKEWTDAGTRRAAYYTNIPPGKYKFTVIACNNDGVWNSKGASVPLLISPHFYQTSFFMVFCAGLGSALCFGVYRLRINHLKAKERKLVLLVNERTQALQEEVYAKERARTELAEAQQHLIELSRLSGRAEVASGVLHNVGNVLNSVNVGASIIAGKVRDLRLDNLTTAVDMLQDHREDLSRFVATDQKGQRVLPYLTKLASHLQSERQQVLGEIEALTSHIDHIKQIVATHQDYAKVSALVEKASPTELMEQALNMAQTSLERHHVEVLREFEDIPEICVPKHRILEIFVNLLRNAKQAVVEQDGPVRQIRLCIQRRPDDRVRFEIHDSGVGLSSENLTRIFAHGFTTKRNGHGFGLHSSALAAQQMHGSLWAESEGVGRGSTFILELPMDVASAGQALQHDTTIYDTTVCVG